MLSVIPNCNFYGTNNSALYRPTGFEQSFWNSPLPQHHQPGEYLASDFRQPSFCDTNSIQGRQQIHAKGGRDLASMPSSIGRDLMNPLFVDCSIEYALPDIPKVPDNSQPILMIAPPSSAASRSTGDNAKKSRQCRICVENRQRATGFKEFPIQRHFNRVAGSKRKLGSIENTDPRLLAMSSKKARSSTVERPQVKPRTFLPPVDEERQLYSYWVPLPGGYGDSSRCAGSCCVAPPPPPGPPALRLKGFGECSPATARRCYGWSTGFPVVTAGTDVWNVTVGAAPEWLGHRAWTQGQQPTPYWSAKSFQRCL